MIQINSLGKLHQSSHNTFVLKVIKFEASSHRIIVCGHRNDNWSIHVALYCNVHVEVARNASVVQLRSTKSNVIDADEIVLAAEDLGTGLPRSRNHIAVLIEVDELENILSTVELIGVCHSAEAWRSSDADGVVEIVL